MIKMRHNVLNVTSINSFIQIKGGLHNDCKDVLFVRALGIDGDMIKRIEELDRTLGLASYNGSNFYNRVTKLPKLTAMEDVQYYTKKYEEWLNSGKREITVRSNACKNEQFRLILSEACKKAEQMYERYERNVTETMRKNFIVKCLFWFDFVFHSDQYHWNEKMNTKIVSLDVLKKQEYIFWYMVSLCGNDVLMLQLSKDVELEKELQELSIAFRIGNFSDVKVECYNEAKIKETIANTQSVNTKKKEEKPEPIRIVIPEKNGRKSQGITITKQSETKNHIQISNTKKRLEKTGPKILNILSSIIQSRAK